ncbi:MAG: iron ABC transporter permease [Desulfatibacillaceae bacterium]|nr:iron ABC transporter permease [Desulfatibacillaceae bacterium]
MLNPRPWTIAITGVMVFVALAPVIYMLAAPLFGWSGLFGDASMLSMRQWGLVKNSLVVAGGASLLSVLAGAPLALLTRKVRFRGHNLASALFVAPLLIPPYIHAIVWDRLSPGLLAATGLDIHTALGAAFVLALAYFPFVYLTTWAGLLGIDPDLEESALLRHRPLTVLAGVVLPLVAPHILAGAIFVFLFSGVDFSVPDILRVRTYPVEIFIQFSAFYDEKAASILSLPIMIAALLLLAVQKKALGNRAFVSLSLGRKGALRYRAGWGLLPAFLGAAAVFGLSVGAPVIQLATEAGGLASFVQAVSSAWQSIAFSLTMAGAAGLAAALLGFFLAHAIERSGPFESALLGYGALVPLAVPAVTMGIGLIHVWNRPGLDLVYTSTAIVVVGYVARFVPFAVITVQAGIKQIDPSLEEACKISSNSHARLLARIVAPLAAPSVLVAFFVTAILALGELGTTLLILPPGRETVTLRIYNLMHYGAHEQVAALCLFVMAVISLCAVIWFALHRLVTRFA